MMRDAYSIVQRLQITEKGTAMQASRKYLFQVAPDANRIEVKRAIEQLFKVRVTKVNTMNYAGKKKRERTPAFGKRADWKRAIVTLHQGDEIPLG
jgi:large subunit ribosomal protein L23